MANIRSKLADWLVRMVYRNPSVRSAVELPQAVFEEQKAKLEALQNLLQQRDKRHEQLKVRIKKNRRQHDGRKQKIRDLENRLFRERQRGKDLEERLGESESLTDENSRDQAWHGSDGAGRTSAFQHSHGNFGSGHGGVK